MGKTGILDEWYETYKSNKETIREAQHYDSYTDLMVANNIKSEEKHWKDRNGNDRSYTVFDVPKGFMDYDVKVTDCIWPISWDGVDESGPVSCITAAWCEYHGKRFILVMPVDSTAEYIETSYTPATYWDPSESDGYYEVDEEGEVGDDYSAIFYSKEALDAAVKEYRNNRGKLSLGRYLESVSESFDFEVFTKDGDSYTGELISELGEDFYNTYYSVVDEGCTTEIGDKDTIDSYHRKQMAIEDEIDRRCGKF